MPVFSDLLVSTSVMAGFARRCRSGLARVVRGARLAEPACSAQPVVSVMLGMLPGRLSGRIRHSRSSRNTQYAQPVWLSTVGTHNPSDRVARPPGHARYEGPVQLGIAGTRSPAGRVPATTTWCALAL